MVKESACQEGDVGLIPELGRSPGEGNGNPIQFLNPMDRGTWWANSTGLQRVRDNLVTKPPPPPEAKRDFSLVFTLGSYYTKVAVTYCPLKKDYPRGCGDSEYGETHLG